MPRVMTVGQVLAQEKTARQRANEVGATIKKNLQKPALFAGIVKTYTPLVSPEDDPRVFQEPEQSTRVQYRVEPDLFKALSEVLAPSWDLTAAKEWGNQHATASIEVDGQVLFADVPAAYLLYLEHQVDELASVIRAIPVLDSAEVWMPDTNRGIWRTRDPEQTIREEKTEIAVTGHPGNEHHAPQLKWLPKSVPTGTRTTVKFSGAVEPQRKEELINRLHSLKQALHSAREHANRTEAPVIAIGEKILGYLFA